MSLEEWAGQTSHRGHNHALGIAQLLLIAATRSKIGEQLRAYATLLGAIVSSAPHTDEAAVAPLHVATHISCCRRTRLRRENPVVLIPRSCRW